MGLYSPWPKSTQTTNNLERIANEMIRDSIKKGEFSNLPGRGRPMESTLDNPVLSTMEQKITVMCATLFGCQNPIVFSMFCSSSSMASCISLVRATFFA